MSHSKKLPNRRRIVASVVALVVIGVGVAAALVLRPAASSGQSAQAYNRTATVQAGALLAQAGSPDAAHLQNAQLLRQEDFSQNKLGLLVGETKDASGRLENGSYHLTFTGSAERVNLIPPPLQSFAIEMECKVSVPAGLCGFIFVATAMPQAQGKSVAPMHALFITGEGYGHRFVSNQGGGADLRPLGSGYRAGQFNLVRVERINDLAFLYVNGIEVQRVAFANPTMGSVLVGLLFGQGQAGASDQADIWVKNLKLWTLQ